MGEQIGDDSQSHLAMARTQVGGRHRAACVCGVQDVHGAYRGYPWGCQAAFLGTGAIPHWFPTPSTLMCLSLMEKPPTSNHLQGSRMTSLAYVASPNLLGCPPWVSLPLAFLSSPAPEAARYRSPPPSAAGPGAGQSRGGRQ